MSRTSRIVRRPDRTEGGLTQEEQARMQEHARLWIARILRTEPADQPRLIAAIKRLYAVSGLPEPRVVVVPSPRAMAYVGGLAAAIWWRRSRAATDAATSAATRDATSAATRAATYAATDAAREFVQLARDLLGPDWPIGVACAAAWWRPAHGGNMWAQYDCYLTAARDVLGLRLPAHAAYAAWEECAIEGSWRWMAPEFCIVSDFPAVLAVDEQRRPHCADGPSHLWRDGWALYYWHGVRVTRQIIEAPETLTPAQIRDEPNAEVRRVMLERFGWGRYVTEVGADKVASDELGDLYVAPLPGDEPLTVVRVQNATPEPDGSYKDYVLRVPPTIRTARDAVAWTFGYESGDEYARALVAET